VAYPAHVSRGRAACVVALAVTAAAASSGCSYDRSDDETLVAATVPAATTTVAAAPASVVCAGPCPAFYGPRPTIDPATYSPACYVAHDQYWAQYAGTSDPASVARFSAAVVAVGAAPDVVAAAERWSQARVDNVARHQAAMARAAAGADLATDPDYVVVHGVLASPAFEADNAVVVDAMTVLCPPLPVMPDTR